MRAHLIEDILDLILLDFLYMHPQTGPDLEDCVKTQGSGRFPVTVPYVRILRGTCQYLQCSHVHIGSTCSYRRIAVYTLGATGYRWTSVDFVIL